MHPIFNLVNSIGGGSADRIDIGLTRFGIKVVHEMNRVGMLVDAAHAGYRTTLEMMEVSRAPVIFSHLGRYSVREHFRNVRDNQIQACAAGGSVIGITSAGEEGLWEPLACFAVEQLPELTDLMLQRGYGEDDVRGILGGNWLRVCRQVWKEPR